jgi:hypothetical protein
MNFRLVKKTSTKVNTVFQVVDDRGDIRGTINIPLGAEDDLLRHWSDRPATRAASPAAATKGPVARLTESIIAAGKRPGGKMTRAAVLRGS